jgi:hypothetical protein
MKQQTRKILTRIGAGLMLGMSLFNLGAIWTRQQGGEITVRTKNIRQKEQEKTDEETSEIASIAEKHVNAIIMSEKNQFEQEGQTIIQESQQNTKNDQKTTFQQVVRYIVITVFSCALGIIFLSVLFNYPISIGGGMLAFAPVDFQTATLSLETEQTFFQANEKIAIDIFLETKAKELSEIELVVQFDSIFLEFKTFEATESFNKSDVEKIDQENGKVRLLLSGTNETDFEEKQKIGQLIFLGNTTVNPQEVAILTSETAVIANSVIDGVHGKVNLLNKTKNAKFSIIDESGKKISCGKLNSESNEGEITREDWEDVILETKLPKDALVWQEVKDKTFFLCATKEDDEKKKLHILVRKNTELKKFELLHKGNKIKSSKEDYWQEDDGMFYSFSYDLSMNSEIQEDNEIKGLILRFDGELSWPKKGLAEIEL